MKFIVIIFASVLSITAALVPIEWQANTATGDDISPTAGYVVFIGSQPGAYDFHIDAGNVTNLTVQVSGPVYLTVMAYDAGGNLSDLSSELFFVASVDQIPLKKNANVRRIQGGVRR